MRLKIQKNEGFSLFELVVFIISVAIIYAYAANRFAEFPAEAERANFLAVTAQLQSAISLELMMGASSGRQTISDSLVGANPMDLLLRAPSNYLGAFDAVDTYSLDRRSWYFDRAKGELVYLINASDSVYLVMNGVNIPTNEIRLRLNARYGDIDSRTGLPVEIAESKGDQVESQFRQSKFKGLVLESNIPFVWESEGQESLLQASNPDFAS